MTAVSLLYLFAELTLILFLVRLVIALWPHSLVGRALTFIYA
jgi:hypothetical protein